MLRSASIQCVTCSVVLATTSHDDVEFHCPPTMTCARALRHAGSTAMSSGGETAMPVPLMWKPAMKRPCSVSYDQRDKAETEMVYLVDGVLVREERLFPRIIVLEHPPRHQS